MYIKNRNKLINIYILYIYFDYNHILYKIKCIN